MSLEIFSDSTKIRVNEFLFNSYRNCSTSNITSKPNNLQTKWNTINKCARKIPRSQGASPQCFTLIYNIKLKYNYKMGFIGTCHYTASFEDTYSFPSMQLNLIMFSETNKVIFYQMCMRILTINVYIFDVCWKHYVRVTFSLNTRTQTNQN